jgi:diaminopimelate epimerase
MKFIKYQALGNDYLILPTATLDWLSPRVVQLICDRHFGVGSDGILLGVPVAPQAEFGLRIFNPDGSQAEKSGNGLRIFARYLYDQKLVGDTPFTVATPGGLVRCEVRQGGSMVFVEMGKASFFSQDIPVLGSDREVINEPLGLIGRLLRITAVTLGNPHCVVPLQAVSKEIAHELGPLLENHTMFPNRTNVQFLQVLDRHHIFIEIWERGAGYTLASGSSSCAAAAVAIRLGYCDSPVQVEMPGGHLEVTASPAYDMTLLGPVGQVSWGELSSELLDELEKIA